jgi:predicted metal-dependent hydrolase
MMSVLQVGEIPVAVTRKSVKNVHLSVHPPDGRVTMTVPRTTRLDVARAYAISKLRWIREQQIRLREQVRETPRIYQSRESHYVWGRRYLLCVVERDAKPSVGVEHRRILLHVRPGTPRDRRAEVMHAWHRHLLHEAVPAMIAKWEPVLGVKVEKYYLQRMKTKWGSCHPRARHIRLNTELVKKPRDLLEYVIVHEMIHLLEPSHNKRFYDLLREHYPAWTSAREELNCSTLPGDR